MLKNDPIPYVIQEIDKTLKSFYEDIDFNILIIDDSVATCRQISSLLKSRNYNISIVVDGSDAYKVLKTVPFDLILLDLELPDINGEEILKDLKKNRNTSDIPIIIMTGTYEVDVVRRLIKQGANEFFLKPFIAEELLLKIDFWIDMQRKLKQIMYDRKILQEYKDAVDQSSIVSKTNKKGIITFVNDKFCNISGYTSEELIGKSHNIIRHPDMPQEAFKNLWMTINNGNIWKGIVKNRKKDGSYYWVKTVISPIVDNKGNIVEFIGIRDLMKNLGA